MAEFIYEINHGNGSVSFGAKQELIRCKDCIRHEKCGFGKALGDEGYCSGAVRSSGAEKYGRESRHLQHRQEV